MDSPVGKTPTIQYRSVQTEELMKSTDPASGVNAEGSNDILRDGANNVGLECRML